MAYPVSSDVSSGQPTAAAHYNNLRADALRLGQASTDAVNLGDIFARFENNLTLQYLATNKVRVAASATAPVMLVVNGTPLLATAAVDLPGGSVPSGGAAWWYVFAVQTAGSTTFTLSANTTLPEAAGTRRIGRFYWDGAAITKLKTELRVYQEGLLGLATGPLCQGRLTLTTGTPVTTSAVNSSTTLYFTPYLGSRVALWSVGFGWLMYSFSEVSITLVGKTASKNNDVFLYDNAGVLTLELLQWTDDTNRATAIVLQDGVYVKSGDATRLYLGTIRINASGGQSTENQTQRFLWNYFNRVRRQLVKTEATSHAYAGTTRVWNNDATQKIEYVVGLVEDLLDLVIYVEMTGATSCYVAWGIDSQSVVYAYGPVIYGALHIALSRSLAIAPSIGYHYISPLENSTGSSTFASVEYNAYVNA
jgi:hypothetical protein